MLEISGNQDAGDQVTGKITMLEISSNQDAGDLVIRRPKCF